MRAGAVVGAAVAGVAARDVWQREHAILRNFPLVGRMRFVLESVGPELRQYIVASNDEERPFSRDQRRWVYASSKRQINTFGFGSDNDYEQAEALVVFKQSPFPETAPAKGEPGAAPDYELPAGKLLGAAHHRRDAFRAPSLVNISGMSYATTPLREIFGYEPNWPLLSDARRAEAQALIGRTAPRPAPGPDAGEHAGFPGAGDPSRSHMDARGAGETASEAG